MIHDTIHYNTIQCFEVEYNTIQCNTTQYFSNSAQYSTTQYSVNSVQMSPWRLWGRLISRHRADAARWFINEMLRGERGQEGGKGEGDVIALVFRVLHVFTKKRTYNIRLGAVIPICYRRGAFHVPNIWRPCIPADLFVLLSCLCNARLKVM